MRKAFLFVIFTFLSTNVMAFDKTIGDLKKYNSASTLISKRVNSLIVGYWAGVHHAGMMCDIKKDSLEVTDIIMMDMKYGDHHEGKSIEIAFIDYMKKNVV